MIFKDQINIKAYLSEVGFDNVNDINVSRRRNLIATFKNKSGSFILKQTGENNSVFNNLSIGNEIGFLEFSSKNPSIINFAFLPQVYHCDSNRDVLISRFYNGYKTLLATTPSKNLYRIIGEQLGSLHSMDYNAIKEQLTEVDKNNFLIQFDGFSPGTISAGGPSILEFIRLIQKYPDLLQSINNLYATFENNCVIHVDFKGDNVLVYQKKEKYYIKFIDYEFISLGDRHYDLGQILGSNLMTWIFKMKLRNESMDFDNEYFEIIKESYSVLIDSYKKVTNYDLNYDLIIKYAGLFLLKIFYNCSQQSREFSKNEIMLLQIARNYLVYSDKQSLVHF